MNVKELGVEKLAPTGFYVVSMNLNDGQVVSDTYYIDDTGYMMKGCLNTLDDKWYFFDDSNTSEVGKMALGWKKIQNDWYYFSSDGTMLTNTMTPDGYKVGADGKFEN